MSMLGLKSLPVNHRLNRAYRICGGLVGAAAVVFGVLVLILADDEVLGISAGTGFGIGSLITGLVLVGAAIAGGNVAAETNSLVGALLMVLGLVFLLLMGNDQWNKPGATMSVVMVLFVSGLLLFSFGVYGRVGSTHPQRKPQDSEPRPEHAPSSPVNPAAR